MVQFFIYRLCSPVHMICIFRNVAIQYHHKVRVSLDLLRFWSKLTWECLPRNFLCTGSDISGQGIPHSGTYTLPFYACAECPSSRIGPVRWQHPGGPTKVGLDWDPNMPKIILILPITSANRVDLLQVFTQCFTWCILMSVPDLRSLQSKITVSYIHILGFSTERQES